MCAGGAHCESGGAVICGSKRELASRIARPTLMLLATQLHTQGCVSTSGLAARAAIGSAEETAAMRFLFESRQEATLRVELGALRVRDIRQRALVAGVLEDTLDIANDEVDTKAAVIELTVRKVADSAANQAERKQFAFADFDFKRFGNDP